MKKEIEELMQITILGENTYLNELIKDIKPVKQNNFTDLEIEAQTNQEFRLVVYKKPSLVSRFFKNIKFGLEKLKIIKHSKKFGLANK